MEVSCRTVNSSDSEGKLNDCYPYSKCIKLKVSWRKAVFFFPLSTQFNSVEIFQQSIQGQGSLSNTVVWFNQLLVEWLWTTYLQ